MPCNQHLALKCIRDHSYVKTGTTPAVSANSMPFMAWIQHFQLRVRPQHRTVAEKEASRL